MSLKFGTSGIRGLAEDFTHKNTYMLASAFLLHASTKSEFCAVSVGMDLRQSSPQILHAVERAISDSGKQILYCGIAPTPALAYYAAENKTPAIMITGSHIPADRNGIKFYLTSGETLKDDDEKIFEIYQSLRSSQSNAELFNQTGAFLEKKDTLRKDDSILACSLFIERYKKAFTNTPLLGIKVLFYEHSSAARDVIPKILEALGAKVIKIGYSETFIPIDTEAVQSLDLFKSWIKEYSADALISTDGDGDRPLVVDNLGRLVQGDKLGIICAKLLEIEALATPISSNSAILEVPTFKNISFTKIGSPYVVAALESLAKDFKTVAGFEANGGFILFSNISMPYALRSLPTRDSSLPIIAVLVAAMKTKTSVASIVDALPPRFTSSVLAKNCSAEKTQKILKSLNNSPQKLLQYIVPGGEITDINVLDGIRFTMNSGQIVHFRPSGNAPEFRCYIEDASQEDADKKSARALSIIQQMISEE